MSADEQLFIAVCWFIGGIIAAIFAAISAYRLGRLHGYGEGYADAFDVCCPIIEDTD